MLNTLLKTFVGESKSLISICRTMISSHSFQGANIILDSIVYNLLNVTHISRELKMKQKRNENTYLFFVEGNGFGHVTQMLKIHSILKHKYKCVGVVAGRQKMKIDMFGEENNIPILNLQEPKFVSNANNDDLTKDTIHFLIDYSVSNYKDVSTFIMNSNPEFIINLHLPIKVFSALTIPVFNISTQNRLNFSEDYEKVTSHLQFDKYETDVVIFASYIIHKSYFNCVRVAIDSVKSSDSVITIPPLIIDYNLSSRSENSIVCYFNVDLHVDELKIFNYFKHIQFHIYCSEIDVYNKNDIPNNVSIHKFGSDFNTRRLKSIGVISSCGVETVYETCLLGIPLLCIPTNSEQLFNAYDHSRKIPGFTWSLKLNRLSIENIVNFQYTEEYWEKHKRFCNWVGETPKLVNIIEEQLLKNNRFKRL